MVDSLKTWLRRHWAWLAVALTVLLVLTIRVRLREIPLEREYTDLHARLYQPRDAIRSLSAIFETSSPGMASPRSSLTRASTSGSL